MLQKLLFPALVVVLVPWAALARPPSARLLDDAPRVAALTPSLLRSGALGATAGEVASEISPNFGQHFLITLVPAIFASTAGVALGTALGSLSNSLLWSVIPAALAQLFVGPVLTTLIALLVGNQKGERFGFWGPAAVTFLLHAAVFVVSSFFLVVPSLLEPVPLLLYTAVDGLVMTAGSVGFMHLFPKKTATVELPSFVPGVSETRFLALSKVEL